ncbi:MAG: proton-translocating NADH-quinone oxidoreductase, chain, partial [Actinoallomurus sp.]|nr:proton-translocating NADH-quinone oxidoreductase, chain [Actinoallomurus sp.]
MILAAMLAVPFLGALLTLFTPAGSPPRLTRLARLHGLFFSAVTLMLTLVAAMTFDYGRRGAQLGVDHAWAASIGLRFHLGVDGISLPLIVLTAALTFLCMIYTARVLPAGDEGAGSARALIGLILLLEVGMIGTFVSLDLVLFFVFFEVVLIPMYFIIAHWGGSPRARAAANKFILYTLLGSGFLLVGILLIAVNAHPLDITALAARHGAGLSRGVQIGAFALLGLGFAVKTPMWPLHTWLPDAHTEAPTVGSVLLAGVLLKMGTYGFI